MKIKSILLSLVAASVTLTACNNLSPSNTTSFPVNNQFTSEAADPKTVVEIKLTGKKDTLALSQEGLDLFGFDLSKKTVRARVSSTEQNFLKENNFKFSMIREANMTSKGLLPGYMTYKQMKAKLEGLEKQYPDIATLMDIGDTWEKNDVLAISITNKKVSNSKPASLFIGGMHARELAPVEIMMKLAEHLLSQYGKDPAVTELINTRDINIVPMVNVDGRIKVENGNNWQRKNTHGAGVDLNRNFDSYWNYQGLDVPASWADSMKRPSSETYSGTAPASEPEIQAIQNFYKKKKLNLVLDMHAYGEMFFWPVGYSDKPIPESNTFKNIYNNSFKNIGYSGGTSGALLYPTTGTTDDYAYVKHKTLGIGMEIGKSFRPSYPEVEKMWTELKPNLLHLIKVSNTNLR